MRKLPGLFTVFAAVAVLATVNAASATPPTGQISFTEHGRAQQAANASLTIPAAADNVSASYTIAPGGDTGWRTGPGDTVLAVFKGALTVEQARECASQQVPAGKSVVVPSGMFRLRNTGGEPVELAGVFFNLPAGGPSPLVDGQGEPAPDCGLSAAAVAPQGVSATDSARGAIPAHGSYAIAHGGSTPGTVVHSLEAGKDMFVITYTMEPGSATGWIVHTDEMAIMMKGTVAIWEARDGKCAKVEEYTPGQAWAHKPHRHMGVNETNEPAVFRIIGFNMKHGEPLPVLGSNLDHIDFSQSPPADCSRLR